MTLPKEMREKVETITNQLNIGVYLGFGGSTKAADDIMAILEEVEQKGFEDGQTVLATAIQQRPDYSMLAPDLRLVLDNLGEGLQQKGES